MASDLRQQFEAQNTILATHLWITGWHKEFTGTDPKGRHYRSYRTSDVCITAVDLQGVSASFAGDRYALQFARKVISQLAANEFREYSHFNKSWESAVKSINWVRWLTGLAQSQLDPGHILQPPKRQIRK